jgi:hypothetical protein
MILPTEMPLYTNAPSLLFLMRSSEARKKKRGLLFSRGELNNRNRLQVD